MAGAYSVFNRERYRLRATPKILSWHYERNRYLWGKIRYFMR